MLTPCNPYLATKFVKDLHGIMVDVSMTMSLKSLSTCLRASPHAQLNPTFLEWLGGLPNGLTLTLAHAFTKNKTICYSILNPSFSCIQ